MSDRKVSENGKALNKDEFEKEDIDPGEGWDLRKEDPELVSLLKSTPKRNPSQEAFNRVMEDYSRYVEGKRSHLKLPKPLMDLRDWVIDLFPKFWKPSFLFPTLCAFILFCALLFSLNSSFWRGQNYPEQVALENNDKTKPDITRTTEPKDFSSELKIHKIFVGNIENEELWRLIIENLKSNKDLTFVSNEDQADAVLKLGVKNNNIIKLVNADGIEIWTMDLSKENKNSTEALAARIVNELHQKLK